jgi:replicative DNA helicase
MTDKIESDRIFSVEQSLIGSLLAFEGAVEEVVVGLYPSHFANKKLGDIYDALFALVKEGVGISPTSVGKRLRDRSYPKADEVEQYLHDMWASSGTAANARWCADEIRKAWRLRASSEACSEVSLALRSPGAEFDKEVDKLHGRLDTIAKGSQAKGPRPLGKDIEKCYLKSRETAKTGKSGGVSTGFPRLDWWTSGLQPSNLIVLAAQTGIGKTSLAMNLAANVARCADGVVVIFSMEMGRNELASRLVASETGMDLRKISSGELSDDQWERFEDAQTSLAPAAENIHLDVSGQVTPTAIRAYMRRIQRRHHITLVIVDYLQLCGTNGTCREPIRSCLGH